MIVSYEDINSVLSKLRSKYSEQRQDKNALSHEKKFAHHALFVLNEVSKELTSTLKEKEKRDDPPSFWNFRKD